ncbi:hypothetical protein CTAYLR_003494 [Chrysophaeum taylorii]|uniref:subtilisin n=1 Tax=Chrysophaeum taylorii TaxID=2483200 RepID=A0AAD7XKZ7_9STRA|nr:hypothetical protein CTAYLR_003494 [Chrysophaeum taylorii]
MRVLLAVVAARCCWCLIEEPDLHRMERIAVVGTLGTRVEFKLAATPKEVEDVEAYRLEQAQKVVSRLGCSDTTRIFRFAGKHEALHEECGLTRWYATECSGEEGEASVKTFETIKSFVENPRNEDVLSMIDVLEPEVVAKPVKSSNDPFLSYQEGHYGAINLWEAWDIETGNPEIVVQVLDTGIKMEHPDLQYNIWQNPGEVCDNGVDDDSNGYVDDCHGYNHADDTHDPLYNDEDTHGTHCGGTIAADTNNGVGVAGVAGGYGSGSKGVKLMISMGFGRERNAGFAEALVYGADNGANISSNSWGYTAEGAYSSSVLAAIDYYVDSKSGIVVFAAGNGDDDGEWYPAYYKKAVAVAATEDDGERASFSNYGSWINVSAPGVSVVSTAYDDQDANTYYYMSGTSMACPHVAGVFALGLSLYPGFSPTEILDCAYTTASDLDGVNAGYEGMLGKGLIDASAFLGCLQAILLPTNSPTTAEQLVPTKAATTAEPANPTSSAPTPLREPSSPAPTYSPSSPVPTYSPTTPLREPTNTPTTRPSSATTAAPASVAISDLESVYSARTAIALTWTATTTGGFDIAMSTVATSQLAAAAAKSDDAKQFSVEPTRADNNRFYYWLTDVACGSIYSIQVLGGGGGGASETVEVKTASCCGDSTSWSVTNGRASADCDWVATKWWNRCDRKSEDGVSANVACPETCNACCADGWHYVDSSSWYKKNHPSKGCAWVAEKPSSRCSQKSPDNVEANAACAEACGSWCEEKTPVPTAWTPLPTVAPTTIEPDSDASISGLEAVYSAQTAIALEWRRSGANRTFELATTSDGGGGSYATITPENNEGSDSYYYWMTGASCGTVYTVKLRSGGGDTLEEEEEEISASTASCCTDSTSWSVTRGRTSADCSWVAAKWWNRCDRKNEEGVSASDACAAVCDTCCDDSWQYVDSSSWYKKNQPSKGCAWVAEEPTGRCKQKAPDGTRAEDSCFAACGAKC